MGLATGIRSWLRYSASPGAVFDLLWRARIGGYLLHQRRPQGLLVTTWREGVECWRAWAREGSSGDSDDAARLDGPRFRTSRHRRRKDRGDVGAQPDADGLSVEYEAIIAGYNSEKDRVTIEETFRRLVELVNSLDDQQERATGENLSDDELAVFDLLKRDDLNKADRERVKQASRELLAKIQVRLSELECELPDDPTESRTAAMDPRRAPKIYQAWRPARPLNETI